MKLHRCSNSVCQLAASTGIGMPVAVAMRQVTGSCCGTVEYSTSVLQHQVVVIDAVRSSNLLNTQTHMVSAEEPSSEQQQ
eukprot:13302-Heterococcus_DN1.PRE.1